jgi:hypothetical protein
LRSLKIEATTAPASSATSSGVTAALERDDEA